MDQVTHTNIRVGPGVYLVLKKLSDDSPLTMGTWANFFIICSLGASGHDLLSKLPSDVQSALVADFMSAMGDLFKAIGMEAVKNTSVSELYQKLVMAKESQ